MNEFDLIVGMDSSTINRAIAQLYKRGDLRSSLFRGSERQNIDGTNFVVQWDIQAAPEISLIPPTDQEWRSSFKADGSTPQPTQNAFILNFSQVRIMETEPESKEVTIPVKSICTANISENRLTIQVLSLLIDLSHASKIDQLLYKRIIIPKVLNIATSLLSGIAIPILSFYNVSLTSPVVSIQSNRLILFANLTDRPLSAVCGGNWPDKPLFILCSSRLVQRIGYVASGAARGKTFSYSGDEDFEIGDASYNASGTINQVSTAVTGDLTVLNCWLNASANVSASVSLNPLKPIIKIFTPWD
jgi:hypothetical protein